MLHRLSILVALALLVFGPGRAHAETVEAATVSWAPYYGAGLKDGGVVTALARAALAREGHRLTVDFVPWDRAVTMAKRGAYDAVLGGYYTEARGRYFHFSAPLYAIEVGLMARDALGIAGYDRLEELRAYRIGYNRGWTHGRAFATASYLDKRAIGDDTQLVRGLFQGELDMVAMPRGVFRHEAAQLAKVPLERVTFLDPPLRTTRLHMMFSRELENAPALRDAFDKGLKAIRADGTYAEILADYGF